MYRLLCERIDYLAGLRAGLTPYWGGFAPSHKAGGDWVLGYRPFFDPAPIDPYWLWFFLPLVFAVAMTIRTIRSKSLERLLRSSLYLAFQISVLMGLAAGGLWLAMLFL